jgi:hypothetical protein
LVEEAQAVPLAPEGFQLFFVFADGLGRAVFGRRISEVLKTSEIFPTHLIQLELFEIVAYQLTWPKVSEPLTVVRAIGKISTPYIKDEQEFIPKRMRLAFFVGLMRPIKGEAAGGSGIVLPVVGGGSSLC